jgi:hypothetical protein
LADECALSSGPNLGYKEAGFASLAYFAKHSLGLLITVAFSSSDPQDAMAFQFVDPHPFIPNGAQWVMVPGRPLMNRAVTGRVHKQNNDLGIATFSPLPLEQLDF